MGNDTEGDFNPAKPSEGKLTDETNPKPSPTPKEPPPKTDNEGGGNDD